MFKCFTFSFSDKLRLCYRSTSLLVRRDYSIGKNDAQRQPSPQREFYPVPTIPLEKLRFRFSCASGPGGQNVNKLATKVELRFTPKDADWIPEEIKQRFIELHKHNINKEGEFILVSQRYRYQELNKSDCIEKLKDALKEACIIPKKRIPTKPPSYAKEQRLRVTTKCLYEFDLSLF
jgi:protein subunit release factor B